MFHGTHYASFVIIMKMTKYNLRGCMVQDSRAVVCCSHRHCCLGGGVDDDDDE